MYLPFGVCGAHRNSDTGCLTIFFMRLLALAWLAVIAAVAGCKDKASAKSDPKAIEAQQQAEQDLLARRDALLQSRAQLETRKTELQAKIDEAKQAGTDTTELETELAKLSSSPRERRRLDDSTAYYVSRMRALLHSS